MVGKGCSGGVRRGGLTQEGFLEVVRLFLFNMQVCGCAFVGEEGRKGKWLSHRQAPTNAIAHSLV